MKIQNFSPTLQEAGTPPPSPCLLGRSHCSRVPEVMGSVGGGAWGCFELPREVGRCLMFKALLACKMCLCSTLKLPTGTDQGLDWLGVAQLSSFPSCWLCLYEGLHGSCLPPGRHCQRNHLVQFLMTDSKEQTSLWELASLAMALGHLSEPRSLAS